MASMGVKTQSVDGLDFNVDHQLINNIKMHTSLWYTQKYNQNHEVHWNSISAEMGIQKSWLKRRWHQLRTEYSRNHLRNPALLKRLSFMKTHTKGVAGIDNNIGDAHEDAEAEDEEFHVTQEQLDGCIDDANCTNAIVFDMDSESTENFAEYEFTIVADAPNDVEDQKNKTITIEKVREERDTSENTVSVRRMDKSADVLKGTLDMEVNEVEYQDKVFGDLVSAMLAKMSPQQKKQAKKEIMNVLL